MTNDFYALLRAGITGCADAKISDSVDWKAIGYFGVTQGVMPLVFDGYQLYYEQCGLNAPVEVKLQWYAASESVKKQNVKLNRVLFLLVKTLREAGIESLVLKGQGCACRYPKPMSRVSGDIDLLVGEEKFDQAMKVLGEAGMIDSKGHSDRKHTTITCNGIAVELHRRGDNVPGRKRSEKFQRAVAESLYQQHGCGFWLKEDGTFGECEGCVWVQTLPDELNVVYVFIHMFRHFIQGGVRLRQVCDWIVLLRNVQGGSKSFKIVQNSSNLNAEGFEQVGTNLNAKPCEALNNFEQQSPYERLSAKALEFGFLEEWRVFCAMADACFDLRMQELLNFSDSDVRKGRKVLRIIEKGEITSNSINGKGAWRRLREILQLYVSCFKAFGIFPRKCVGYLTEIVWSNVRKYVLRRKY